MVQMNAEPTYSSSGILNWSNLCFVYRFDFQRDSAGSVATVTYTTSEGTSSLALKKSIASLFSLSSEEGELAEKKKTSDSNIMLVYSLNGTLHGHARESRKVCTMKGSNCTCTHSYQSSLSLGVSDWRRWRCSLNSHVSEAKRISR